MPKNTSPFQRVPVMARAIAESEAVTFEIDGVPQTPVEVGAWLRDRASTRGGIPDPVSAPPPLTSDEFADLLLWCHAPVLQLRIQSLQRADPSLRSSVAQRAVLNIEVADLQSSLMRAWHLPELLRQMGDDCHAENANVRSIELAARLARHSLRGWENAAIPDDIAEIASLLQFRPRIRARDHQIGFRRHRS